MDKRDLGITIGICASLAVHVGVLTYSADRYAHTSLYYPSSYRRLPGVLISLKPKTPLPTPRPPQPVNIGDIKGTGDADFDSPGDIPLSARQADETQAWYTVHRSGEKSVNSSKDSDDPTLGENGRGGPRSPAAQA
ncbi:MAG TPA: hypothetical protein VHY37_05970, partial [Tepidisphaeraceae bacterium]|nr:hypothetical protein [Tepidisphaeraceae bacterium]